MFNRKSKIAGRYERQIALIGEVGQKSLKDSCIIIVGAGGLGNIAAKFLASAGVNKLIIIDHDKVEKSNLNRQFLFNTKSINKYKSKALKKTLKKINPEVIVIPVTYPVNFKNSVKVMKLGIAHNVNVILDCTDNMPAAYVIENIALNLQKPLVFAKTSRYYGMVTIITKPFLKSQYPNKQLNENGAVFGPIGGIIGSIQASLALKIILGLKLDKDILYYDALNNEMIKYKKGE